MEPYSPELLWIVVAGFVFAFVLAFGIGANDVANSFGTSVGSKVLTLSQACMLATVFEIAGAVLIGYKVSDTMRKGILDVGLYAEGGERQLAAGCLAALIAGAAWLLLATALGLPVSGTHSVVGATVGFTLAAKGAVGIRWPTLGAIVSDTTRKGILDVGLYAEGGERQLAAGCLAALIAGAAWLLLATALGLPVSGTHSVVGATVGFTLAAKGAVGIRWPTLGAIVASWFISPVLSGAMSSALYWLIRRFVLRAPQPLRAGLISLPFFYGCTVLVNVFSVVHDGPKLLHMDNIPLWGALLAAAALGVLAALLVQALLVPYYRRLLSDEPHVPVDFTLGPSNDTTPANSPTHAAQNGAPQRPTSLVSEDGKLLGAQRISETAEMVTLSAADKLALGVREMNLRNRALLATMDDCSILSRSLSPPHRARLHLTDADPQLHTLKYIDETMSWCRSVDSAQMAGMGESYGSRSGFLGSSCDTIARAERDSAVIAAPTPAPNHASPAPDLLARCPSAWSVESGGGGGAPHPALTPNSSAAPLLLRARPAPSAPAAVPPPPLLRIFSFLQILTASFGGFAHGGNDVSNAIGPLIALWLLYSEGAAHARAETPLGILLYGGVGIAAGLWLWGRRVIKTVGEDLTRITPDTGFTIELGAALTVLVASKVGLPVSTTHCKVGSVVFVGALSQDSAAVDWALFRNIIFAWIVTVPAVAGLAALIMFLFDTFLV